MNEVWRPAFKSWRLNERMYGALTGLSKVEIAELVGEERANLWRASLHERPPPLEESRPSYRRHRHGRCLYR